jgi:hypothetical protein
MRALLRVSIMLLAFSACANGGSTIPATPGSGSLSPGFMRVTLRVAGSLDFSKYHYWIVFNTSGNGSTPEANPVKTNWGAYSDAVAVDDPTAAAAIAFVKNVNPAIPPQLLELRPTPAQLQFGTASSAASFTIVVQRSIFAARVPSMSNDWRFNAFTQSSGSTSVLFDSMGSCGGCFRSPTLAVNTALNLTVNAEGNHQAVPPAARIVSVEFANKP